MKKKKGFTLIELLAVIVVLAIIMIIAIPNILNTMNTSKTSSFKVEAQKMFNEAAKKYEEEGLAGVTISNKDSSGGKAVSVFNNVNSKYTVGISSVLASTQNKYIGCVVITPSTTEGAEYSMTIYMTDNEFYYSNVAQNAVKSTTPTTGKLAASALNTACGSGIQ